MTSLPIPPRPRTVGGLAQTTYLRLKPCDLSESPPPAPTVCSSPFSYSYVGPELLCTS